MILRLYSAFAHCVSNQENCSLHLNSTFAILLYSKKRVYCLLKRTEHWKLNSHTNIRVLQLPQPLRTFSTFFKIIGCQKKSTIQSWRKKIVV